MIDYYEALKEMHNGNVVKYVGMVPVSVCVVVVSFSLMMA